jgi:hypothetical protein
VSEVIDQEGYTETGYEYSGSNSQDGVGISQSVAHGLVNRFVLSVSAVCSPGVTCEKVGI